MKDLPSKYKVLLDFEPLILGNYKLLPIRYKDRYDIMRWRNDQIYHLRQKKKITSKEQDLYFKNVLFEEFNLEQPKQILFSFLKNDRLVGYGGLVHINWELKDAEISFLMKTDLEKKSFLKLWSIFLKLIEIVAFEKLGLYRLYTYSFNLRPKLYDILKGMSYIEECKHKSIYKHKNKLVDAIINAKYSDNFLVRKTQKKDSNLIFLWSNDYVTRSNSLNKANIEFIDHQVWFKSKIVNNNYFFMVYQDEPVGTFRLDKNGKKYRISLNVSPTQRGKGIGNKILLYIINNFNDKLLEALVKKSNLASNKIFTKHGFKPQSITSNNSEQIIKYLKPPTKKTYA